MKRSRILGISTALVFALSSCEDSEEFTPQQVEKKKAAVKITDTTFFSIIGFNPLQDSTRIVGTMAITNDNKDLTVFLKLDYEPVGFWQPRVFIGDIKQVPESEENYNHKLDYDVINTCDFLKTWEIKHQLKSYKAGDTVNIATHLTLGENWLQVAGRGGEAGDCDNEDIVAAWVGNLCNNTHYVTYTIK